jgi:hypothetical protein
MSWTTARLKAANDTAGTNVSHVVWSENGTDASANVAPTAVTLKAATTADPSVVSNDGALESAGSSSDSVTITHFAFAQFDDPDYVLQTTWNALDDSKTLDTGDKLSVADGALKENLYQATSAPA